MKKNIVNLSVITEKTLSEQSEHQMMCSFAHVQSILFWNEAISHLQSGERETQFWERNYQFLSFYTLEQALAAFERAAIKAVRDICVLNSMIRQETGSAFLTEKIDRNDCLIGKRLAFEIEDQYKNLFGRDFREVNFPR